MNNINYHRELEKIISGEHNRKLLLHSCCAPCSSYCLIYLYKHFDITCFYCNPNITDKDEYEKRLAELSRLIGLIGAEYDCKDTLKLAVCEYEPERFIENVRSAQLETAPEGGSRCGMCFRMRLEKTYEAAVAGGYDYFATTLSISPHKNAGLINSIGSDIAKRGEGPMWLPADFKKNNGYLQSIKLSEKYGLYRQNYCGCEYSKR